MKTLYKRVEGEKMKDYSRSYRITNNALCKKVIARKHFLKRPPAIAIDKVIFDDTKDKISEIQIFEEESGYYYVVSVEKFIEKSFLINRGFGDQYVLTLQHWNLQESLIKEISLF